jgi:predicted Ser/Thr protein kinase
VSCPHGADPVSCAACHSAETGVPSSLDAGVASTMVRALPESEPRTEEVVAPEVPAEGGRIGRFVVVEAIGQGGMGVVLKAYDPALDRRVAVKLLRPGRGGSRDSGGTARLAREAQAMARLAHPNVVPVYDVGRYGESLFVAMEYVTGTTLHRWLAERPRGWREVLGVLLQAGRGLEAAHAAGIVHRDFKPANVLVGEDGRARVTDFGLARSSRDDAAEPTPAAPGVSLDTPITLAGAVMGTPGYMAPEQYVGRPSTPATDQYAFCITLYEALYGQRPFEGTDLPTLTQLTQAGQVPPPPRGTPVPAWLHALIVQGLAPDPVKRHPTMTALLARLEADPSERRRRRLRGAAAVVLALGVAGALWAWPMVRASSCHRDTERLAAVWGSDTRARVERAFLGQPSSWDFVRSALDGFALAWTAERHQACDDTLRTRQRTERQLALRLACLDSRRVELQTLVAGLERERTDVAGQAVLAVTRLTPVSRCGNLEALEHRSTLDDAARTRVEAIEQQLAEGRVLVALADFAQARPVLVRAVEQARALGDEPTLALAVFELGALEREENLFSAARVALEEAVRTALASRDDRTALHALALLASVVGWRLDEPRVALALVTVGRGLVPRVKDPLLEALLFEGEGDARWRMSDNAGSLAAYQRAQPLFEQVQGPNGLDVARMHSSIGWLLMERGALTQAREAYERSKRSREALLGADHPALAQTWNELAQLATELDDREGAVTANRRALELRRRTRGINDQAPVRVSINLARALVAAGHLVEAEELVTKASTALDLTQALNLTRIERARSELLFARGDLAGALAAGRRALAAGYDEPLARADIEAWVGRVLAAKRDDEEARAMLTKAAERYAQLAAGSTTHAQVLLDLATVLERVAPKDVARAAAQRALEAALAREGNQRLKARASLLAARAREAAGDVAGAREAATAAVGFAVDDDVAAVRAEAERLLATQR